MIAPIEPARTNEWSREFGGARTEIGRALAFVESIARTLDLGEDTSYALMLCVEELVSNVLMHNSTLSDRLHLRVTVERRADRIVLTIRDNGAFFDVVNAPVRRLDQTIERVTPGGLGVGLVRKFASSLDYDRIGDDNRVVATFMT